MPKNQPESVSGKANPTTYDIAHHAKVSQMTVSRVLRGTGYVSDAVKTRVLSAADELGYIHNNLAGAFAGQTTKIVGVIVPALSNAVFTEVLAGLDETVREHRLQPAFGVTNYDPVREYELVREMLGWRPAGLVLTGLEHDERTRQLLSDKQTRVVEVNDTDGTPISTCVGLSHRKAGRITAKHLLERGHRNFVYIGIDGERDKRAQKRREGFEEVLNEAGHSFKVALTDAKDSSMLLGRQLTEKVLTEVSEPVAIYYSNDDLAAGGLMHCIAQGISIPEQVAMASFNGLDFLNAMPRSITTFKSPRYEIGQIAGQLISETGRAPNNEQPHIELEGELVIGDTS